jgi:hypothetical protein
MVVGSFALGGGAQGMIPVVRLRIVSLKGHAIRQSLLKLSSKLVDTASATGCLALDV